MPRRSNASSQRSGCPISISLETFGDRWSLLIVRDLLFAGSCSFRELAEADERIASNILADRLERLEAAGIIRRFADASDGRKAVYRLTRKGVDLAPMLVEMIIWAARHEMTEAPPALVLQMERNRARYIAGLRRRWSDDAD